MAVSTAQPQASRQQLAGAVRDSLLLYTCSCTAVQLYMLQVQDVSGHWTLGCLIQYTCSEPSLYSYMATRCCASWHARGGARHLGGTILHSHLDRELGVPVTTRGEAGDGGAARVESDCTEVDRVEGEEGSEAVDVDADRTARWRRA